VGVARPFAGKKNLRLPRPCPCVLLQGQGGEFDLGGIRGCFREIKIPALSQKTRQGRGTLESRNVYGPPGLKARAIPEPLRGAEAPLFHGIAARLKAAPLQS